MSLEYEPASEPRLRGPALVLDTPGRVLDTLGCVPDACRQPHGGNATRVLSLRLGRDVCSQPEVGTRHVFSA